jgi:Uma2 family endonuclease
MSTTFSALDYYLHETWEPDREFVDGEILERNLGEKDHASWQAVLVSWLRNLRQSANVRVYPELRVQTSPTHFRVPDVVVVDRDAPDEQVITHPPLLCVEILSPEDRFARMEEKIEEYFRMGVRAVWVIDPRTQTGYQCAGASFKDWKVSPALVVPGTPITIEMSAVIADLD